MFATVRTMRTMSLIEDADGDGGNGRQEGMGDEQRG